jgi:hypothetical protein
MQTRLRHLHAATFTIAFACTTSFASAQSPIRGVQALAQGACATDEVRSLAFLIGDWRSASTDLSPDAGSPGRGINHIEGILGGCAILQHRYEETDGKKLFDSVVMWAFDVSTIRMREFVISDDDHAQVYEGIWENGGWVFYRDRIGTVDQMWLLHADRGADERPREDLDDRQQHRIRAADELSARFRQAERRPRGQGLPA